MSDATQVRIQGSSAFRLRDYHPLRSSFPETLQTVRLDLAFNPAHLCIDGMILTYNPEEATDAALYTPSVWALPVSLATTQGISVDFFSSGY